MEPRARAPEAHKHTLEQDRLMLLAKAGAALASSADDETTLQDVARFLVPELADWAFLALATPEETLRPVAIAHADPRDDSLAANLATYVVPGDHPHNPASLSLRARRALRVMFEDAAALEPIAVDAQHLALLRELAPSSAISVPLLARDQVLGVLTCYRTRASQRIYEDDDISFFEALSSQAALAMQKARLRTELERAHEQNLRTQAELKSADEENARARQSIAAAYNEGMRVQQAAQTSEELLSLALEAAGAGAFEMNLQDQSTIWTPQLCELFGLPNEPTPPFEAFLSLVHPDDRAVFAKVPAVGDEVRMEYRVLHPTRGLRWFAAYGRIFRDAEGRRQRFNGIVFDMTERKQVEERLAASDRKKDEFLAMLAHELRNPIAALALAAELARSEKSKATSRELHEVMLRQTHHLERMVDDLLDVARVTRGKIELQRETVEIGPLIAPALDAVHEMMTKQRHRVTLSIPPEPLFVDADPVRLEQVLVNLLSNAAKFTPAGGVIGLRVEADEQTVELRVTDTGPGLSPEMRDTIFQPFAQVDLGLARNPGGLGLGLTIARRLVELHGGTLVADSEGLGKGSTFIVRLPRIRRATQATPRHAVEPAAKVDETQDSLRVLVVDDNADAAELLRRILCTWKHDVRTAPDGFQAIALAPSFRPDVVILDIGLPGMDGYAVADELRRTSHTPPLLVALTGYGQTRDFGRSEAAGFHYHLVKPVNLDALARILSRAEPHATA